MTITANVTGYEYHTHEELVFLVIQVRAELKHQAKIAEERHKMIVALEKENIELKNTPYAALDCDACSR